MSTEAEYLPSAPSAPTGRGRPVAAVAVAVVALLASSLFALVSVGAEEGADSPEAAVRALLDAVASEDVLGVVDALVPAERDALRPGLVDLADELRRLEILSPDLSLSDVAGVDVSFDGVTLASEPLGEDRVAVRLTGGQVSTRVDPAALPLGDFVRGLAGPLLAMARPQEASGPVVDGNGPVLVALREGGRWYVSFWYSVAEAARNGAGEAPEPGDGVPAAGAATPEDAVRDFLEAAAHLDVRRLIELMPPDEAAALHDYAPLFLGQAEQGTAEVRRLFELRLEALELSSKGVDGGTLVQVRSVALSGSGGGASFEFRDGCVRFEVGGEEQRTCAGDVEAGDVPAPLRPLLGLGDRQPDLGFVTVERDGAWFVSPTRTVMGGLVALASAFEREDLDVLARAVGALLSSGLLPGGAPGR